MNKRTSILTLLLTSAVWISATAQNTVPKHDFSVQQCIEYASKNNYAVKNALLGVKVQEQVNKNVTAAALPTISGTTGFTNYIDIPTSLIPGQFFGQPAGTYVPVQFGTKYNANAGLQLQQLLFDGQVFVGLQARDAAIAFSQKNAEVTEENIKANIYKIYYQLVVSKTSVELIEANIARLQKLEHDTKALYQNGFAEKLDVDRIAVQVANLQTEREKTLRNVEIGYLGLKTLMGMPVKEELTLTDKITEDQIKKDILKDTAYNYTDRKEFQYLSLAKKLNEYNIKRYQLSKIPTLSLAGAYTKNAQRQQFDFFKAGEWYTTSYFAVNMSVPIFSGLSKNAKIQQSRYELQQTENSLENLKLSIDNDVKQAQLNFSTAITTMDVQKKNMELAENVFAQTNKKYEVGTGSNTEINSAQTDLITAQTNYINAMYLAIIAKVDYLKAIGKLP